MATWSPSQSTVTASVPLLASSTTVQNTEEKKIQQVKKNDDYNDALKTIEDFLEDLKSDVREDSSKVKPQVKMEPVVKIKETVTSQEDLIKQKTTNKTASEITSQDKRDEIKENSNNGKATTKSKPNFFSKAAVSLKVRFKKKSQQKDEDDKDKEQQKTVSPQNELNQLNSPSLNQAEDMQRQAINSEAKDDHRTAYKGYTLAKAYFNMFLKSPGAESLSEPAKELIRAKIKRCEEGAANLEPPKENPTKQNAAAIVKTKPNTRAIKIIEVPVVFKPIIMVKPNVKWTEIAGLEKAKDVLERSVLIPTKFPEIYDDKYILKPWRGILLYGPSGVGKLQLAKALATEINGTLIYLNISHLIQLPLVEIVVIRKVFELAKKNKPAIILFADIHLMSVAGVSTANHRAKIEFLTQMQAIGADSNGLLVLGATDKPWIIEPAVQKRFVRKLYTPLLDQDARKHLIELHIGNVPNDLTENDKNELAAKTHHCSGANIIAAVREALMEPLRIFLKSHHFKFVSKVINGTLHHDFFMPCSGNDPDAISMNWNDVPRGKLVIGKATRIDFDKYFAFTRSRVTEDDLKQYDKYMQEFGVGEEEQSE